MSYANCGLPYYVGGVIAEEKDLLLQTPASLHARFRLDVRVSTEVLAINPSKKVVAIKNLINGQTDELDYDKLILSPGASPVVPPIPGIERAMTLRTVEDVEKIAASVGKKPASAVVIGGGFIGVEIAENLVHRKIPTALVEATDQVLMPLDPELATLVANEMRSHKVDVRLGSSVVKVASDSVELSNGEILPAEIVILAIGVRPEIGLAKAAGLEIGIRNGIKVDEFNRTSNKDIYAVGDAIEFENPITHQSMITYLAGPANKQGRICADNVALGNVRSYKGSINTAIVKVFDMTVGTTGTASKHLTAAGIEHIVSTTHSGSHAGYYPGSKQMTIQLAFAPKDGRLLSAQIAGYDGVDKRLDVIASYIKQGKTIYDLIEFEHAYAPPYSSAKDPVNMAGFVAENILLDRLRVFYWDKIEQLKPGDLLIDVRREDEFEAGNIAGAINIPVDELRNRLAEIPVAKNIYIYCEAGLRGYLAQRILRQNGYNKVANLSGGYYLWKSCTDEQSKLIRQPQDFLVHQ